MNDVWKAPETCRGMIALGAEFLGMGAGLLHGGGLAGDDDLAGCVEVRDPHVGVGEIAGHLDLVVVETEHRRHRADVGGAGVVHGSGPLGHQRDSLVEPERTRRRERGVLAETVTGTEAGLDTETFDGVEHHQTRHERRELRVAGVL